VNNTTSNNFFVEKIAHSYLLISEKKENNLDWFNNLKDRLNINLVDICIIDEDKQIKIEQIRKIQTNLLLKPHSSKYKLFFIHNADNLRKESANSLLKTLEEPPSHSVIVLSASSKDKLLPTITSRCRIIKLKSTDLNSPDEKKIFSNYSIANIRKMKLYERFFLAKELVEKDQITNWIKEIVSDLKNNLEDKKNRAILKKIIKFQKILKTNANFETALCSLLVYIN